MYYLNFLLLGELTLLGIALAVNVGDILSPSVIMTAVFTVSSMVTILHVSLWKIEYSQKTMIVLLLGLGTTVIADISAKLISVIVTSKLNKNQSLLQKKTMFSRACLQRGKINFLITLGVIGVVLFYFNITRITGTSFIDIVGTLSRYRTLQVGNASVEDKASIFIVFLNRFLRAGSYISIFIYFYEKAIQTKLLRSFKLNRFLIPATYLICMCILNSSRGELIKLVTFAFAANYIGKCRSSGWRQKIGGKYIIKAVKIFVPFVFSFYGLAILMNRKPKENILDYLSSYIGGSIQHINQYISDPCYGVKKIGGNETFAGMQSLLLRLGIINEMNTTHMEFRWLGKVVHGNIYTFFRRPLHDFGIIGMCVFTFIIVFSFGIIYHIFVKKAKTLDEGTKSAILYCYLLPWLTMASIEQLSVSYFSIGTFVEIVFLFVWYKIMYKLILVLKRR